jgi:hypothetical protein
VLAHLVSRAAESVIQQVTSRTHHAPNTHAYTHAHTYAPPTHGNTFAHTYAHTYAYTYAHTRTLSHAHTRTRRSGSAGSPFGPIGATLLARGLRSNRVLAHLDLSNNAFGDEGLVALADGIKAR